jgi:hypothetical protein
MTLAEFAVISPIPAAHPTELALQALYARAVIANGTLVVDLCLLVIFIIYLRSRVDEPNWSRDIAFRGAFWLLIYFSGRTIATVWGAMLISAYAHGRNAFAIEAAYPVSLVGTGIALVGLLGVARVFSPPPIRNWGWLLTGILVAAVLAVSWLSLD